MAQPAIQSSEDKVIQLRPGQTSAFWGTDAPRPREEPMAELTREEMAARIEAAEARVETKLVSIEGKLDRLFDRVEIAVEFSRDAKTAASNIKWNIIFTALAVIGIMFAAWGLWAQGVEMVSGIFEALPKAKQ